MNLPIVADEHEQERKSIREFRNIMEGDFFIIRDCRESDYGNDLLLELKIDKQFASNFTAGVQLKDKKCSKKIHNQDGSYSYSIKVSNLNYLLNNTRSIIAIYLEDEKKFVWEWVHEIEKKADEKEIDFSVTKQKTYTYRFNKFLDEDSKKIIYGYILEKGSQEREREKKKFLLGPNTESNIQYDTNISVDSKATSKALKLYINKIMLQNRLNELLMITQYSTSMLRMAIEKGIMTTRLVEGMGQVINVDIGILIGARQLNLFEQDELVKLLEENNYA